jgi:hypothetical protein
VWRRNLSVARPETRDWFGDSRMANSPPVGTRVTSPGIGCTSGLVMGVSAGPSCDRAGALETREQRPAIRWLSDRLGEARAGVPVLIVL